MTFSLRPRHSVLTVLLIALGGCSSYTHFQFRAIDATSGAALEGVKASASTNGYHFDNRLFPDSQFLQSAPTKLDGLVDFPRVLSGESFFTHFTFEKDGYERLIANDTLAGDSKWQMDSFPGRYNENPSHRARVSISTHLVDVLMYRRQARSVSEESALR
jgi:hypothetical protein